MPDTPQIVDEDGDVLNDVTGSAVTLGGLYLVHEDDCCMAVTFTATLVEATSNGWPRWRLRFDNGVVREGNPSLDPRPDELLDRRPSDPRDARVGGFR